MTKIWYDERRVLALNSAPSSNGPVLYVMAREQRTIDNWALIVASAKAKERGEELLVLFALAPMFNHGSARHNEWMVTSLKEVSTSCRELGIPFYIEMGDWAQVVTAFVEKEGVGEVVFDFNPLEPVRTWREEAAARLSVRASVVDARNIIPTWVASPKGEFSAATFRPKVHRLLAEFLKPFPRLEAVLPPQRRQSSPIDLEVVRTYRQCDYGEVVPNRYTPGMKAGNGQLKRFCEVSLEGYSTNRNDPNQAALSGLSPYLRWGNISAQRVALTIQEAEAPKVDREAYLEELIVRRELSDNFCYYHRDHGRLESAHAWAQATLNAHVGDAREQIYTYEQFKDAKTHDDLWNAAQQQMIQEGKMHGFLRMYWAKKILEWTPDPQTAIDIALRLNDHYQLDGRDSNGVVGVMWAIAGVHDRAWGERPVFGKIRYMNYAGCKRKFDVAAFVKRYNGHFDNPALFS